MHQVYLKVCRSREIDSEELAATKIRLSLYRMNRADAMLICWSQETHLSPRYFLMFRQSEAAAYKKERQLVRRHRPSFEIVSAN